MVKDTMQRSTNISSVVTASITTTPTKGNVEIITPEPMNVTVAVPAAISNGITAVTAIQHKQQQQQQQKESHHWYSMTRTIAHYDRLEQIGLGTYGQVYRAICKDTGRIVAMKKMRNSATNPATNINNNNNNTTTITATTAVHQPTGMPLQLIREIKILKQLQHPNLLSMIEVVTSKGVEHLDIDDPIPISSSNDKSTTTKKKSSSSSKKDEKVRDKNDRDETKKDNDDRIVTQAPSEEYLSMYHQQRLERERYKGNLFLVLEYMTHDLTGLLDVAYEFSVVQIKCIMKQLLLALQYMHEHKYIHRDIKSSNILLDSFFHLKLADFGLARSLEPPLLEQVESYSSGTSSSTHAGNTSQDLTNKVITLWYRPPEILLGTVHYGCAVDVWSAGCILAELITGKPLATGKTELDQLTLVADLTGTPTNSDTWEYLLTLKKSRSTPSTISNLATEWSEGEPRKSKLRDKYGPNNTKHRQIPETALTLLEKVLEWDPRKRITAANALQHRYFWSQPVAPDDPAELGRIDVAEDGHFHEFVTKQKRKQAKQLAEQSREKALRSGATTTVANEKYDEIYMGIMKQVAQEGFKSENAKTEEIVVVPESKKTAIDDDEKYPVNDRRKGDGNSTNQSRRDRKHSRGGESMEDDNDEQYDKDDPDHDSRKRRQKKKRSAEKSDERSSSRSQHHHDKRRYSDDSEHRSDKGKRRSRKDSYVGEDVAPADSDIKYDDRESYHRNQEIGSSEKEKKSKKHSRRDSDSGRGKKDRHSRKSDRDGGKKLNDLMDRNERRSHDDRYHRNVSDRDRERQDIDRHRRPSESIGNNMPPPATGIRNEFARPYDNGPLSRGNEIEGRRRLGYDEPPPRNNGGGGVYGDYRPKERRDNHPGAGPMHGDYRSNERRGDAPHRHHDPPPPSRQRERDGPLGNHYNAPPLREFGDRYLPPPQQRRDIGPGPYPHGRDGPGRGGDHGPRDIRPPHDDYPRRDRDGPRGAPPHPPPGPIARRDGPVYGSDQFYRRDGGGGRRPDSSDSRHPRDRNR